MWSTCIVFPCVSVFRKISLLSVLVTFFPFFFYFATLFFPPFPLPIWTRAVLIAKDSIFIKDVKESPNYWAFCCCGGKVRHNDGVSFLGFQTLNKCKPKSAQITSNKMSCEVLMKWLGKKKSQFHFFCLC